MSINTEFDLSGTYILYTKNHETPDTYILNGTEFPNNMYRYGIVTKEGLELGIESVINKDCPEGYTGQEISAIVLKDMIDNGDFD